MVITQMFNNSDLILSINRALKEIYTPDLLSKETIYHLMTMQIIALFPWASFMAVE